MINPNQVRENWRKRSDDLCDQIERERNFLRTAAVNLPLRTAEINSEISTAEQELQQHTSAHIHSLQARDNVLKQIHSKQKTIAERKKTLLNLKHKRNRLARIEKDKSKHKDKDIHSTTILKQENKMNQTKIIKLQKQIDEIQQQMYTEAATAERGLDLAQRSLQKWKNETIQIKVITSKSMVSIEKKQEYQNRESNIHHQHAIYEGLMDMLKNSDHTIETLSTELAMRILKQIETLRTFEYQIERQSSECQSSDKLVRLQEAMDRIHFVRNSMPKEEDTGADDYVGPFKNAKTDTETERSDKTKINEHFDPLIHSRDLMFTPKQLDLESSKYEEASWHQWLEKRQEKVDVLMHRSIHSPEKASNNLPSCLNITSSPAPTSPAASSASSAVNSLLDEINIALTPRREAARKISMNNNVSVDPMTPKSLELLEVIPYSNESKKSIVEQEFVVIEAIEQGTKNNSVWESPEELVVATITPNLSKDSYQSIIEQESIAIEQGTQAARIWESPESLAYSGGLRLGERGISSSHPIEEQEQEQKQKQEQLENKKIVLSDESNEKLIMLVESPEILPRSILLRENDTNEKKPKETTNNIFRNLSLPMLSKVKMVMSERALLARVDAAINEDSEEEEENEEETRVTKEVVEEEVEEVEVEEVEVKEVQVEEDSEEVYRRHRKEAFEKKHSLEDRLAAALLEIDTDQEEEKKEGAGDVAWISSPPNLYREISGESLELLDNGKEINEKFNPFDDPLDDPLDNNDVVKKDVVKSVPRLDSKEQFNLEDDSSFSSSDDMGESLNLQEIDLDVEDNATKHDVSSGVVAIKKNHTYHGHKKDHKYHHKKELPHHKKHLPTELESLQTAAEDW